MKKKVTIYTDGACSGNPGPGGYGVILQYTKPDGTLFEREYAEGFASTTNNRMEVLAALTGLKKLTVPCSVTLYSDSQYLVHAFNERWYETWVKENFRRGKKNEVKNIDLWEQFAPLLSLHDVTFVWVKGHAENKGNNRCDELAVGAYKKFLTP